MQIQPPHDPPPIKPTLKPRLAALAVAACLLPLPWLWDRKPEIQMTFTPWLRGEQREFMSSWTRIDDLLRQSAGTGNVAIRFVNFDRHIGNHVILASSWHARGAYALYPQRVFVADDGVVLLDGLGILDSGFSPSLTWLQDHKVKSVVTLTMEPGSETQFRGAVDPVPERDNR